jgi:hypothetical protein
MISLIFWLCTACSAVRAIVAEIDGISSPLSTLIAESLTWFDYSADKIDAAGNVEQPGAERIPLELAVLRKAHSSSGARKTHKDTGQLCHGRFCLFHKHPAS